MRSRLGLLIAIVSAALLTPISQPAFAVSTYPSAPRSVTATAIAGGVRVGWIAPADVASGITAYRVEYSTTGASGTWTQYASVSSSTYSSDIIGLSQVTTYVRVVASASGNFGTYGYPWTKLYGTTSAKNNNGDGSINYESNYGIGGSDTSTLLAGASFSRIRYRMDSTINGVTDYAETDFYKWVTTPTTEATSRTVAPTISNLQIPVPVNSSSGFVVQANVQDLNVYSSNSGVTNGAGVTGRVEIWPWNYDTTASGLTPGSAAAKYDYDDSPAAGNTAAVAGSYGSFQVHDLTNTRTVFAWNYHSYGTGANDPDLGYGNNPNSNGHPDWTFCHDNNATNGYCQNITYFRLQIFINLPVTPLVANSTTSISLPLSGSKGLSISITATSNLSGFYTFTTKGKRIAGCYKRATSGSGPYTATCTWKPTFGGFQSVVAVFSNAAAGYIGSQAAATIFISKRTTLR
jgi:hypothetical protein